MTITNNFLWYGKKNSILVWRGNRKKNWSYRRDQTWIYACDRSTGIFVSFYWINNTSAIFYFLFFYVFIRRLVMCENTLDKKRKDVFFRCLSLNRVDRLMTPMIHDDDDGNHLVAQSIMRNKCTLTLTCDYRCSFTNEHRHIQLKIRLFRE